MTRSLIQILSALLTLAASSQAMAWGERGHNAIARVATRLVADQKDPATAAFGSVLQSREHMLGHLANVPDIVWRSAGPEIDAMNAPSHFIDLDYILPADKKFLAKDFPTDFEAFRKAISNNCGKKELHCAPGETETAKLAKTGHAPFRIQQLSQELTLVLSEVKKLEGDPKAKPEAKAELMDKAFLYAGIMAHFIGDLANPHHTSMDYDGWHTDQGGLHSYFESDQVDAQSLDLEQAMFNEAIKNQPAIKMFGKSKQDPLLMAWELTAASHQRLDKLLQLDRKFSLVKKSDQLKRIRAERKASKLVAKDFRSFLVERLSVGADGLAAFWIAAWDAAGRPKLDGIRSYNYPVKPDFIPLSYIPPVAANQSADQVK
jgi:hypothetical protein